MYLLFFAIASITIRHHAHAYCFMHACVIFCDELIIVVLLFRYSYLACQTYTTVANCFTVNIQAFMSYCMHDTGIQII